MDISISINSDFDDEYRIILSPFNLEVIPNEVRELLGDNIEIADVTLERVKGDNQTDIGILLKISNVIAEVFDDNENLILYFYCDDIHDILRRNTSDAINCTQLLLNYSIQAYYKRSLIF